MFNSSLRVFQVILAIWATSWACAQEPPVATVPWAQLGQGPDRTCCSPYAGPLNAPRACMQLLHFTDQPLTHVLLDRFGMLQTVSLDGCLYKFNAGLTQDQLVIMMPLPWSPTDMALGFDGTAYISMTEHGYGRLAAVKDGMMLWEREFAAGDDIYVLPILDFAVLVLTSNGRLFNLDAEGKELWTYVVPGVFDHCTRPSEGCSGVIYFSANGVPSRKSVSLEESYIFAISRDGVKLWERPAPVSELSYPVIDEQENVYVTGSDGLLYSFCAAGLNWAEPATGPGQEAYLAYHENKIIVLSGGNVTAYSRTGQRQPLWSVFLGDPFVSVPALGSDGMTYALTRSVLRGSLPALTAIGADGNIKWSVPLNCDTQTPPIITIEGNICLGTSEGGLVHFEFGRGDMTPPYVSETFPPTDTVVPIDDFNVMITLADRGVGVRPSSIYVLINDELADISIEDVIGGCRVVASRHPILAPFQNVLIEVSAEDRRFNRKIRPFHLTAVEYRHRPTILMAGFGYTHITSSGGGKMDAIALMDPLTDVQEVELHHTPSGFSLHLEDNGVGIDPALKGRWYSASDALPAGLTPGRYKLEIHSQDTMGRTGLIWPYLAVERDKEARSVRRPPAIGQAAGALLKPMSIPSSALSLSHPVCGSRRETQNGNVPIIVAAGYTYSHLGTSGGVVRLEALVDDPDGIQDVERVEVYMEGRPIGLCLNNEGEQGDSEAGDAVFTFQIFLGGGLFASGDYLYELVAFDTAGNESDLWPYLEIGE
ncbi:MAG: PQQ-like beta-propeller repeat protein [Candidatus Coatesbacteria bacterium]|nr:PQQ-like beta-propeller repeat protein [Candidatus Coatesbacteria bacterium]